MVPVIAITGPTASGKSAISDLLAQQLSTEVISADAMQVYRGMDIGTAKTPVEERLVPLQLVDVVDASESYSAALFQIDARAHIDRLIGEGRVPILCGGTGLYLKAALDDMVFPSGEVGSEHRARYQQMAEDLGADGIYRYLAERDPRSAEEIHPNNVRRVIRALEMLDEGISYADQKAGFSTPCERYPHLSFALTMNRDRLYRRIDQRVDLMMEMGLLDEVRCLVRSGAGDAITSRQAIGYKELMDALDGMMTIDEAVSLIKQRSRRYAKRQLSWCRRDARIIWIDMDLHTPESACEFIRNKAGL